MGFLTGSRRWIRVPSRVFNSMHSAKARPVITILAAVLALSLLLAFAPTASHSRFCSDAGCSKSKQLLRQICDYIVAERSSFSHIYVGGYYSRTLVAGYEVLGDRKYLDTAIAYGDYLLDKQMPN